MKRKNLIALLSGLFLAITGYYGYESTKEVDNLYSAIKHNVEALSDEEITSYRYPKKDGKAQFCTLYVYKKGGITVSSGTEKNPFFEGNAEYSKETQRGLEDCCPDKGEGCNPYSCQTVPY